MTSVTGSSLVVSLVLDASAAVDLTLGHPGLARLLLGEELHVPVHFDVEVVSAFRSLLLRGAVGHDSVADARATMRRLVVVRHLATVLVERAWELRERITIHDGVYVALAEGLDCPLVTTDSRLAATAAELVRVVAPDS